MAHLLMIYGLKMVIFIAMLVYQMKCMRCILKTHPTFIDRTRTNQIVRDRAKSYNVEVTEISVVWKKRKLKKSRQTKTGLAE